MAEENQADKFYRLAKEDPAAGAAAPARAQGMVKRIAIYVGGAYILVCICFLFFQHSFIFHPVAEKSLLPREFGFAASQAHSLELPTVDGQMLRGWYIAGSISKKNIPAPRISDAHLVALYFCDSHGNRSDRVEHMRRLAAYGAHVVCFDYRGFGDSTGTPSEKTMLPDAQAAYDHIRGLGIPANAIVLHGHGLGAAVATKLAARLCTENSPPGALVLEAPFTRVADVIGAQLPVLPVGLLLGGKFDTATPLKSVTCPVLIFRGGQDGVLTAAEAQSLAAQSPKAAAKLIELPNCGRDDLAARDTNVYLDAIRELYIAVCPQLEIQRKPRDPDAPVREPRKRIRPRPEGKSDDPPTTKP